MELAKSMVAVNCATPGKELRHMTDTTRDRAFVKLLTGKFAIKWTAILLSGGGNDLIDAARIGPETLPNQRLLARPDERPNPSTAEGYISEPGWQVFAGHLTAVFDDLIVRRDSGVNKHVHSSSIRTPHIMPRPAPAGPGFGPWLEPAMRAFAVPSSDWLMVSKALIDRLAGLLQTLVAARQAADPACALHLVDTRTASLVLGAQAATGRSGDFQNEIHPTAVGYEKVAVVWATTLDQIL